LIIRSCRGKSDEEEIPVEYVVFAAEATVPPSYMTAEEEKEQLKTVVV
jgi:hypothetical protein